MGAWSSWSRQTAGALAVLWLACGLSRPAVAGAPGRAEISGIVEAELASKIAGKGGLVVAVRAGGVTQVLTYGDANQTTGRPVTPDTLFNVASIRKLFEATLVALGTIRGDFSLDDPASKFMPELTGDYVSRITIGELVTHTSGLLLPTDHPPWPTRTWSLPEFIEVLNRWTPAAQEAPGRQRIYTHAGYVLLQLVLERIYKRPIGELVAARILAPLGMRETYLPERTTHGAALPSDVVARMVQGYDDDGTPLGAPGDQQGYYDFPGAGQIYSTVGDLAIFAAACLGDDAVDPELRQALTLIQRETFRISDVFGQAMAFETVRRDGIEVVDKPGGLNNATAYVGLVPRHKIAIVLLANRGEFPYEIARYRVLPQLAKLRGQ